MFLLSQSCSINLIVGLLPILLGSPILLWRRWFILRWRRWFILLISSILLWRWWRWRGRRMWFILLWRRWFILLWWGCCVVFLACGLMVAPHRGRVVTSLPSITSIPSSSVISTIISSISTPTVSTLSIISTAFTVALISGTPTLTFTRRSACT